MTSMLLQVKSRKYTLTMDLKYRINLIHSDSGIGKTTARDFIFSSRSTVTLDGEENADRFIEFFSAADVATKSMRLSRILLSEAKLIILDEIEQLSTWSDIDVADYNRLSMNRLSDAEIKRGKINPWLRALTECGAVLVIISRKENYHLPVALEAVYDFKAKGTEHFIVPKYGRTLLNTTVTYDAVITEDSQSGCKLFRAIYGDRVIPAFGKDHIVTTIGELYQSGSRNMLLIVDTCALGTAAKELFSNIQALSGSCIFSIPMICSVEYCILRSNLFRLFGEPINYLKLPKNIERYFTNELNKACLDQYGYSYSKGECRLWEEQMNEKHVRKQFENTEFESLIRFHVKEPSIIER